MRLLLGCLLTLVPLVAPGPAPDDGVPRWIWHGTESDGQEVVLRKTFQLEGEAPRGLLSGTCDNQMTVRLNGEVVLRHDAWEQVVAVEVELESGENVLEVEARNGGGPAGLALRLRVVDGPTIVTDGTWRAAAAADAPEEAWSDARTLGEVGAPDVVWSSRVSLRHFDDPQAPPPGREAPPQAPRPAPDLSLLPGYEAEILYEVPRAAQGSWVALCADAEGRLYASDQADKGIYRITPAALGDPEGETRVDPVDVPFSGAQGLCWAFDSLYANGGGRGLARITDTDGDDELDQVTPLISLTERSEHGPHAVVPTPDGQGLYVVAGNYTRLPELDGSRVPTNWGEDHLLPRRWDARGHAVGKLAPGGWILRCAPDGSQVELVSSGYRNPYDLAVSPEGELFTYDADMEWDLGLPWYRPTRICHATSGSEFGWRAGTGKWPSHREDSLPSVVDIGPGSPTGLVFGTGTNFRPEHRRALFALDWTFGTIYAVHLEPKGASYTARVEPFAWGKPFGVTDAAVGRDGSLYVTVGGRGSRSALYRITYTGPPEPELEEGLRGLAMVPPGRQERMTRKLLERDHGRVVPGAVDRAWSRLGDRDRHLRFAARISLEHQPVDTWRDRALNETRPRVALTALMALARQGAPEDLDPLLESLARLDLAQLPDEQLLAALRVTGLAIVRLGAPGPAQRRALVARLDPLLPSSSSDVNRELVTLLVRLQSELVVPRALDLIEAMPNPTPPTWGELVTRNDTYGGPIARMLEDMPPVDALGLALPLRVATEGWTLERRQRYFGFLVEASRHPGGASYAGFLEGIREDAAQTLTVGERRALADLLGAPLVVPPPTDVTPPKGPGRSWTVADALATLEPELRDRDFERGRELFHGAKCSTCHRFDGSGGAIGPDLTTVASKFAVADLVEALVEPDRVIADQYGSSILVGEDGFLAEGIVVEEGDELVVYPRTADAEPAVFDRAEVTAVEASTTSQMPSGLLDPLSADELRDLVAYLLAGGDARSPMFKRPPGDGR